MSSLIGSFSIASHSRTQNRLSAGGRSSLLSVHGRWLVSQVVIIVDLLLGLVDHGDLSITRVKFSLEVVLIKLLRLRLLLTLFDLLSLLLLLFIKSGLGLCQLNVILLLAVSLLLDSLLAVVLDVLNVVASGDDVFAADLECRLDPLQHLSEHHRELLDLLLVQVLDVVLQE